MPKNTVSWDQFSKEDEFKNSVDKGDVGLANVENFRVSTTEEAQAGTSHDVYMTPLRTYQTIQSKTLSLELVKSVSDLEQFENAAGEYVLPEDTLIMIDSFIDLGNKAIRLSKGSVLRGLANGTIQSTNTEGVIRATNVGSNVILREFSVVATHGPAYVLEGTIDHQLNMFFCGAIGEKAGVITGFDVQAVKQCFVNAGSGFTNTGTTNKVFYSETPFYGVTDAAVTLGANLNASVMDIVTSFFKFDAPGTGIKAEVGYSVGEGMLRGTLIDGTATPLDGLNPADLNWTMSDNSGIRDSRIAGELYLDDSRVTTITTAGKAVKVEGITKGVDLNERIEATDNNQLTYMLDKPGLLSVMAEFTVDGSNNDILIFYLSKNEQTLERSRVEVKMGTGDDKRSAGLSTLVEVEKGDFIEVWAENESSTSDIECTSLTLSIKG